MRKLSDEEFMTRGNLHAPDASILLKVVHILKERSQTFVEAQTMLDTELAHLFTAPTLDTTLLSSKGPMTKIHLEKQLSILSDVDPQDTDEVKDLLMGYADTITKEEGGRGAVLWPLRYALSGLERSPDPFTIISIISLPETLTRIKTGISLLS